MASAGLLYSTVEVFVFCCKVAACWFCPVSKSNRPPEANSKAFFFFYHVGEPLAGEPFNALNVLLEGALCIILEGDWSTAKLYARDNELKQ